MNITPEGDAADERRRTIFHQSQTWHISDRYRHKMHGISSLSNSSVSGHRVAATIRFPPAALEDTEPQRLHDVNRDLWQRTFQSVMANAHDQSPTLNISFGLHDYSLPTLNSGSPPQPLQAHVFPSPDNPSHYSSASPPELATTGPNFQTSHIQDA
ncbi:hypothetical protein FOVG_03877 [Fusarium oxysporum f. sp. pisi HDV247]|uniref:Uncharacterized protein n=1 Tax=Fusarium oxysporum f. sp. pisi HDV247 TaxID=1080344 RepID=W9PMR6_FUSOX|nr:hypothetical protein FOVG_03877 [Fusarium oxysporum f. sp. pisi HDV247]